MKTALVVLAHPDDEAYGPAGTIHKLSQDMKVVVVVMCSGARPGSEHVQNQRQTICRANLKLLGVHDAELHNYSDTKLELPDATSIVESAVCKYSPSLVLTHDSADLHRDHRTVNEATLIACRPTPTRSVQSLYTFEIPGSSEWGFGQYGTFTPSVYVDVTQLMPMKQQLLQRYTSETYQYPDSRSVESMRIMSMSRGKTMGMEHAEAFRLVYARGRTIW